MSALQIGQGMQCKFCHAELVTAVQSTRTALFRCGTIVVFPVGANHRWEQHCPPKQEETS